MEINLIELKNEGEKRPQFRGPQLLIFVLLNDHCSECIIYLS